MARKIRTPCSSRDGSFCCRGPVLLLLRRMPWLLLCVRGWGLHACMHPPIHPHAPAFACVRWFASACCTGWRIEDSVPSLSCLFSSSRSPVSTSARRAVRRLPLRGQKDQLAKASHKNPARPQVSHRKVTSDQRPHLSVIQRTERDRSISIGCREAAGAGRAPKRKNLVLGT